MYKLNQHFDRLFAKWQVLPYMDAIGPDWRMGKPWHIRLFGAGIKAGKCFHVVASKDALVRFTVWAPPGGRGELTFGDACLVAPGSRFMAGERITIGDGCLFAHSTTVTDCDWHGIYDRTDVHGLTKPVTIGDNVWLGDGAFVGKGVTIGDNSVIGARAIVATDIPANSIAVGNPAKVIRTFDPEDIEKTRMDLFADAPALYRFFDGAYEEQLKGNSIFSWLKAMLAPGRGD